MRLFGWLRGKNNDGGRPVLEAWHQRWRTAAASPAVAVVSELKAELDALKLPEEEVEIEREMLDGLDQLAQLHDALGRNGLPIVETGHRVVGTDTCHFSAPSSMPDDPSQASGRLIFTGVRAIFAGGGRTVTLPWHAVAEIIQQDRDLVLVKHDRETFHRFRCNVYADAMCAGLLAKRLAKRG
jgi:hypothetical protein